MRKRESAIKVWGSVILALAFLGVVCLFTTLIPSAFVWIILTKAFSFNLTFKSIYWATYFIMFLLLIAKGWAESD